jgi:hypothetical protein
MKVTKLKLLAIVGFVFTLSLIFSVTPASAGFDFQSNCEGIFGGVWLGSTYDEVGATCEGAKQGFKFDVCGFSPFLVDLISPSIRGETWTVLIDTCRAPASSSPAHTPAEPGRCRLISVDKPVYVGSSFQAEWRGPLNSLRLREPGASVLFLSPVPGSVHWTSNSSRVGTFATSGLVDVGNYFASCFSNEGMVGAEIKTIVRR